MADSVNVAFKTQEVKDLIRELERKASKELAEGVQKSTEEGQDLMREDILNDQGHGKLYPSKQNPNRTYRASAPGEPPATDTGTYRDSWRVRMKDGGLKGELFTADKRGPWLEFGTAQMESRPHVIPWMRRHAITHRKTIFQALRKAALASKQ